MNTWVEKFEEKILAERSGRCFACSEVMKTDIKQFISDLLEEQKLSIRKEVIDEIRERMPEKQSMEDGIDVYNNPASSYILGYNGYRKELLSLLEKLNK